MRFGRMVRGRIPPRVERLVHGLPGGNRRLFAHTRPVYRLRGLAAGSGSGARLWRAARVLAGSSWRFCTPLDLPTDLLPALRPEFPGCGVRRFVLPLPVAGPIWGWWGPERQEGSTCS